MSPLMPDSFQLPHRLQRLVGSDARVMGRRGAREAVTSEILPLDLEAEDVSALA